MTRSAQTSLSATHVHSPIGGNLGGGKSWTLPNGNRLSVLASVGVSNENQILKDAYVTTMTAQGTHLDKFNYDSYSSALK